LAACGPPAARSTTRSGSPTCAIIWSPPTRRSPPGCGSRVTTCGHCSTTSNGPRVTRNDGVSCTSTSTPRYARSSAAPTGIAMSPPPTRYWPPDPPALDQALIGFGRCSAPSTPSLGRAAHEPFDRLKRDFLVAGAVAAVAFGPLAAAPAHL